MNLLRSFLNLRTFEFLEVEDSLIPPQKKERRRKRNVLEGRYELEVFKAKEREGGARQKELILGVR